MKKILKVVFGTLASLVLLVVLVFLFWLGPAAKALVEELGPRVLGVPVTIESLSINPRKGTLDLRGFQIGIHEGFSRTNTWDLADLRVSIDIRSLLSDTIVIHEIQINSPHFVYEQNRVSDNISEFIQNIQAFAGIDPDEPRKEKNKKDSPPNDGEEKAPRQVVIERLVITDMQAHLANTDDPQLDIYLGMEELSLSLTNGIVQLDHLLLSDPGRLATPNAVEIESIEIKIDPTSIYSEQIVIEDVRVTKPYAFLELNADSDTVSEFMRLAQTFIDKTNLQPEAKPESEPEAAPAATSPEPPPFELRNLFVDDLQVKLLDTTQTHTAPKMHTLASIGSISVRLVEGRIQIKEITVPNPEMGFTATHLFYLADINIALDPESICSDQVIIQEVFVDSPEINIEQTESSGNVAELQRIVESFIPPVPQEPAPQPMADSDLEKTKEPIPLAEQPVVLETLIVTNFAIHMIFPSEPPASPSALVGESTLGKLRPKNLFASGDTNTAITLMAFDRLSVEPLKGLIQIDNLRVGNPPDFAHENLATILQFRIDIDPDSLQTDTLLIEDLLIDTPRITYERQLSTDNIQALQASIEAAFAPQSNIEEESKPEKSTEPIPPAEAAEQKVIIEHLLVKNGKVKAKLSALPSVSIPLPTIERSDIGKKEDKSIATAFADLGTLLYDTITGVVSGAAGLAGDTLKGTGSLTFGALGAITGGMTDSLGKQLGLAEETEEITEQVEEIAAPVETFQEEPPH